jgi:hypothetical protein
MTVTQEVARKEHVIRRLRELELDQMALWIEKLPDADWERRFKANWPMLAKKCGIG